MCHIEVLYWSVKLKCQIEVAYWSVTLKCHIERSRSWFFFRHVLRNITIRTKLVNNDHYDLILPCQYVVIHKKPHGKVRIIFIRYFHLFGIDCHVIFHPVPLSLLPGRDSSTTFFRVPFSVFPSVDIMFCDISHSTDVTQVRHISPPIKDLHGPDSNGPARGTQDRGPELSLGSGLFRPVACPSPTRPCPARPKQFSMDFLKLFNTVLNTAFC